jgi:hypothetical protein
MDNSDTDLFDKTAPAASSSPSVGYKRPPVEHRFKKGQSGNRKGRPVGSRNFGKLLGDILQETVPVRNGGRVTNAEALAKRALHDAMNGDPRAVKALDFFAERLGLLNPPAAYGGPRYGYLVVPRKLPRAEWEKAASAITRLPEPQSQPRDPLPKMTVDAVTGEIAFHPLD